MTLTGDRIVGLARDTSGNNTEMGIVTRRSSFLVTMNELEMDGKECGRSI